MSDRNHPSPFCFFLMQLLREEELTRNREQVPIAISVIIAGVLSYLLLNISTLQLPPLLVMFHLVKIPSSPLQLLSSTQLNWSSSLLTCWTSLSLTQSPGGTP